METQQKSTDVLTIPLADIVVDEALQPRGDGLDAAHIEGLRESPDAWPPLAVVEKDGYLLVDGFHRYAAAQNLDLETIRVKVRKMPADGDLRGLAFDLNKAHGRPLSLSDRRDEAERMLRAAPKTSNQTIAKHTALSPTTVAAIRERLESGDAIPGSETRVDSAGRTYAAPQRSRQPGELPDEGIHVGDILTGKERKAQKKTARYLQRLRVALDDQWEIDDWEDAADAVTACRSALGEEKAAELGELLGPAARRVLDVAIALGYADDATETAEA